MDAPDDTRVLAISSGPLFRRSRSKAILQENLILLRPRNLHELRAVLEFRPLDASRKIKTHLRTRHLPRNVFGVALTSGGLHCIVPGRGSARIRTGGSLTI